MRAEDQGEYFRVPVDARDLNYSEYFEEGDVVESQTDDYHSHNTERLDVDRREGAPDGAAVHPGMSGLSARRDPHSRAGSPVLRPGHPAVRRYSARRWPSIWRGRLPGHGADLPAVVQPGAWSAAPPREQLATGSRWYAGLCWTTAAAPAQAGQPGVVLPRLIGAVPRLGGADVVMAASRRRSLVAPACPGWPAVGRGVRLSQAGHLPGGHSRAREGSELAALRVLRCCRWRHRSPGGPCRGALGRHGRHQHRPWFEPAAHGRPEQLRPVGRPRRRPDRQPPVGRADPGLRRQPGQVPGTGAPGRGDRPDP